MVTPVRLVLSFIIISLSVSLLLSCRQVERGTPAIVDDPAHLLDVQSKTRIDSFAQSLLKNNNIELQVYILKQKADNIDDTAHFLFEREMLGSQTGDERGLLFVVDPKGKQVKIEVGYGLEPFLTDVIIARFEREQMAPFFLHNRVGDGIEAILELLVSQAPAAAMKRKSLVPLNYSGGGGARSSIAINEPLDAEFLDVNDVAARFDFVPCSTPLKSLEMYRRVLMHHIKDPNLTLYTPSTRRFLSNWQVTIGQQNTELRDLEKALPQALVFEHGALAVVRFPVECRQSAPYFFQKGKAGWQLDFATMSRVIGFNHQNQWFFRNVSHSFYFAFDGWLFDDNGFPIRSNF